MKLEDQVCSLELAKRLKELGVKQESYFYWINRYHNNNWSLFGSDSDYCAGYYEIEDGSAISAFTVAELGEMLPPIVIYGKEGDRKWTSWANQDIPTESRMHASQSEPTEAGARAKMLIHLIEKGLIKHEQ